MWSLKGFLDSPRWTRPSTPTSPQEEGGATERAKEIRAQRARAAKERAAAAGNSGNGGNGGNGDGGEEEERLFQMAEHAAKMAWLEQIKDKLDPGAAAEMQVRLAV